MIGFHRKSHQLVKESHWRGEGFQGDKIRAHVFICVLSYLLERRIRQAHLDATAREGRDRLADIKLAKTRIGKRLFLCSVEGDAEHKKILDTERVKNILPIFPTQPHFQRTRNLVPSDDHLNRWELVLVSILIALFSVTITSLIY